MICENCIHHRICGDRFYCSVESGNDCGVFKDKNLIVELPCRVGDTVYCCRTSCDICEYKFGDAEYCGDFNRCGKYVCVERKFEFTMLDEIGKTVFLTKAEAEQALERMNEK